MSLSQLSLTEVLDRLSATDQETGGLSAAALTCALAASLIERAARTEEGALAIARLTRCSALRERLLALDEAALRFDDTGVINLQVVTTSLTIASCAAQLTSLAAESAAGASDVLVGEAIIAAELTDGACRAAAHILRISLRDAPGDQRRTEATGFVNASSESLQAAFAEAVERQRAA